MEPQQPIAYQHGPPPFLAAQMTSQKLAMDLDYEGERRHRATSVISGMSQEDMEAAETLNSLQTRKFPKLCLEERLLNIQISILLRGNLPQH